MGRALTRLGCCLAANVAVWLLLGNREQVSKSAVEALEEVQNEAEISAASVWEIAIKRSLGELSIADGWSATLRRLGFDAIHVTALHAEAAERLPWHHLDPFDRLLVARALVEALVMFTNPR